MNDSECSGQQGKGTCLVRLDEGVQVVVGDGQLVGEGDEDVFDCRVR